MSERAGAQPEAGAVALLQKYDARLTVLINKLESEALSYGRGEGNSDRLDAAKDALREFMGTFILASAPAVQQPDADLLPARLRLVSGWLRAMADDPNIDTTELVGLAHELDAIAAALAAEPRPGAEPDARCGCSYEAWQRIPSDACPVHGAEPVQPTLVCSNCRQNEATTLCFECIARMQKAVLQPNPDEPCESARPAAEPPRSAFGYQLADLLHDVLSGIAARTKVGDFDSVNIWPEDARTILAALSRANAAIDARPAAEPDALRERLAQIIVDHVTENYGEPEPGSIWYNAADAVLAVLRVPVQPTPEMLRALADFLNERRDLCIEAGGVGGEVIVVRLRILADALERAQAAQPEEAVERAGGATE